MLSLKGRSDMTERVNTAMDRGATERRVVTAVLALSLVSGID